MTSALITGITGQDGSYLAEALLARGWQLHALVRPGTHPVDEQPVGAGIVVHEGDLSDPASIRAAVAAAEPDVIFNLAGISSVARSWNEPVETSLVTGTAVAAVLDAAQRRQDASGHPVRVVQASSAEIFGDPATVPQDESTAIAPISPYGAAKAYAHLLVGAYRRRGMHASAAILYNHESPRRPPAFVTRKITQTVARIARGQAGELVLGSLDARRDWGWAPDYVEALIRMAEQDEPGDYVVATGESHSVGDFVAAAFAAAGIDDWQDLVRSDPAFIRPVESAELVGDATRAREVLGWAPTRTFPGVVAAMVEHDLALLA
ncbi:MAG: GDP-mannose 4,6-dehydratase [Protaetiibacter sp.]